MAGRTQGRLTLRACLQCAARGHQCTPIYANGEEVSYDEIFRRWNAFEDGGAVALAIEALRATVARRDFCVGACARYAHYEDFNMKTGETERSTEDEGEGLCDCGAVPARAALAALTEEARP